MKLSLIPKEEIVLLDANIILYAVAHASVQCEELLRRCAGGEITCRIPSTQFSEVMHRLMVAEARDNSWVSGANPARQLSEKPDRVRSLHRYQEALLSILALGVVFEPVLREDFLVALALQREFGFMANDALFAACGRRLRINAMATADKSFSRLTGAAIYAPTDVHPRAA